MSEPMPNASEPATPDRAKYVFGALALVFAAVGAYVLFVLPGGGPGITYRTLAVQLGDPERVQVTFEVTKPPVAEAECQVTAVGDDREIVNRLVGIRIPPSGEPTTKHIVTVATDQLATDATVTYCTIVRGG
ncbi:MAG TPA: DUF4307 domain-containing protein [Frankiaceae bacterium]|nr:DUF4307 domain-containing protein [Frankiaceae bacterium]